MEQEIGKYLLDILNSILEIESFVDVSQTSFFDYQKDLKTKRAVERNLEIVGEAMNRILKKQPEITIENAKKIVQFRNFVIHSYDSVTDETVWGVLVRHLPLLKREIVTLLQTHFPDKTLFGIEN